LSRARMPCFEFSGRSFGWIIDNIKVDLDASRYCQAEPVLYSPPGERPNAHALPSTVPAAANLGIPAGAALIKALMRGILPAIPAEAAETLGSFAGKSFATPSEVRH
jgi:hypothetical protein